MVEKSFPNLRSGESLSADVARKSVMSVWIAGIRENVQFRHLFNGKWIQQSL